MRKKSIQLLFLLRPLVPLGALVFFIFPVTAANISSNQEETIHWGGIYRRPLAANPFSLDPARTADIYAYTVINQIFDGLVQFDGHLNPVPAIAGFWEASLDGLVWTFYLRKDVKFHNGQEVTADDFVYSFTRILDPGIQSPVAELFQYIQGAEEFRTGKAQRVEGLKALDRHRLQISLEEPYTPFLSILAMANAKVVPQKEVEKKGSQFSLHPVGSGPFVLQHWEQGKEIILQAHKDYYEGSPFLDQIIFKVGKKDLEGFHDFLNGELEESPVPSTKATEIRENDRYLPYTHLRKPILHLLYIGFNTRQEPFTNKKVRQAFNYAIDKEAIVREIRKNDGIVAHGILPPGMPGYNPELASYYYSPQRAKELLAEAGYPEGNGLPVIDLWYGPQEENTRKELEAYRRYLADLGVVIEIHQAPDWPTLRNLLQEGKLSMFRLAWYADIPDPDNFLFPLLFSQSKMNRTFYQNLKVNELLQKARSEVNYTKRIEIYREVEKIALEDAPWISQHHKTFEYLYQPYVRGVEVNALGAPYVPMKKIWLDKEE